MWLFLEGTEGGSNGCVDVHFCMQNRKTLWMDEFSAFPELPKWKGRF